MFFVHFMRPWWFVAYIPLLFLFWQLFRQSAQNLSWRTICDKELLTPLLRHQHQDWRLSALILLFLSAGLMIFSLTGPSWSKTKAPVYAKLLPRVVVLDMSDAMLERDVAPNRLARAKFKLRDLFHQKEAGQFGLVVYTDEPFVVSPLTQDGQTIEGLLSALSPEIMPVDGQRLDLALKEAKKLISQAGFKQGQILVMTAEQPSQLAIEMAKTLVVEGIHTSILPLRKEGVPDPSFQRLAQAGEGRLLQLSDTTADLEQWIEATKAFDPRLVTPTAQVMSLWRDDGRWFLGLAMVLLLPVFRRGHLLRVVE